MTTIAYRDGILAADTGETAGNSRLGRAVKIVRRADGALAAAAGNAVYAYAFKEWFRRGGEGQPPEAKSENNTFDRGVIFHADGRIEVFEPGGKFFTAAPYYALGSGRPEALGAMFAGASAIQAIKAAMVHDSDTFGDIAALSHDGAVVMGLEEPVREAAE